MGFSRGQDIRESIGVGKKSLPNEMRFYFVNTDEDLSWHVENNTYFTLENLSSAQFWSVELGNYKGKSIATQQYLHFSINFGEDASDTLHLMATMETSDKRRWKKEFTIRRGGDTILKVDFDDFE